VFVLAGSMVVGSLASGCGQELLDAPFTSRVVQHEVCSVVGEGPEQCEQAETLFDVSVHLLEKQDSNVWLSGVPRAGIADRSVLGSRNDELGFTFVDQVSSVDKETGCTVIERLELVLKIDPEAKPERVGTDACVALLGREYLVTSSSPGCDALNDPQLAQTRIARRRWQPSPECKPE
jgi:hypothetical protein